ncbi:VQ motif-containing protein 11-like [Typha latifolia]|uniref:VQ motif-containing protein 11-like n=1 Tax=Typha latifolia TaxID=4733 RepID=UPI003C2F025A
MDRNPNPNPSVSPTTYVQAEAHTFRDLVQRLTGAAAVESRHPPFPSPAAVAPRRQAFKLQDRRGPTLRNLDIHHRSAGKSPIPSPVTPLGSEPLFSPPAASEEERAIAEKGFYLHPSPRSAAAPPELLPLFPLCSPKQKQRGE